jgi:hypothetical protein
MRTHRRRTVCSPLQSICEASVCATAHKMIEFELENWRRRPDLNRGWRFCSPVRAAQRASRFVRIFENAQKTTALDSCEIMRDMRAVRAPRDSVRDSDGRVKTPLKCHGRDVGTLEISEHALRHAIAVASATRTRMSVPHTFRTPQTGSSQAIGNR